MEKIITPENLKKFAYVNDAVCKRPIKGIIVSFFGLNVMTLYDRDVDAAEFYAEKGFLYVIPYNNPWAWMNKQAVYYTDEIIDVLIEKYNLSDNIPIISKGGSMGGQSALVYAAYAKRTPVACVANCPVCDVVFHFTERDDLPKSLYSSLYNEPGTLRDALESISPLHIAEKLPKIKYHIFHCNQDKSVNIYAHSEKLVAELKKRNYDVTYDVIDGRGHCDLTLDMKRKLADYIINSIEN